MEVFFWKLYVLLCLMFVRVFESSISDDRFADYSFPGTVEVFNHEVSCGNITEGSFPSKTWTCTNISVNGVNLAYGFSTGSLAGVKECTETEGKHEFVALCVEMLKTLGVVDPLWAVYIPQATCRRDYNNRTILVKSGSTYKWEDMPPGLGYVKTLQCMIKL